MALPVLADLKDYLRIESDAENTLLAALLVRAQAMLEGWIDVPLTAESQTAVDRAEAVGRAVTSLVFPRRPIGSVAITDVDGEPVDTDDYWVDATSGVIYAKQYITFPNGPYTITANVGLSLRPDYTRLEPLLAECILDLAADLYQRRTPGADTETGAGTTIAWDVSRETVARVLKTLRLLKLGVAQ